MAGEGRNAVRVRAEDLQEAGDGREEGGEPDLAAAGAHSAPAHEAERGDDADERHNPDREAEDEIAVVGEAVAERADPVVRGQGRDVQLGARAPIVGEQRAQRKEREREEQPGDDVAPRLGAVRGAGGRVCHVRMRRTLRRRRNSA